MSQLFVYGSLLRGEERDGLVAHLSHRPATTKGKLWRAPAGYPALELDHRAEASKCEVLTLESPAILTVLDMYEGVREGLYDRIKVTIQTPHGEEQAWAYVMNSAQLRRAQCTRLKGSDWRSFTRRR